MTGAALVQVLRGTDQLHKEQARMNISYIKAGLIAFSLTVSATQGLGQELHQHGGENHAMHHAVAQDAGLPEGVHEGGQAAFAAIQEIVAILMADPATDWEKVNIEALRQHLIDMDNVTLRAEVSMQDIDGGARFEATSTVPPVTASIRAMVPAHVATMNGVEGWSMTAEEIPGGAALVVTGGDAQRIRALGFIGIMTVGMHHQAHHLALAKGVNPHDH